MPKTHYDEKIAKTEEEFKAAIEKQQGLHESIPKDKYINKQAICAELTDTLGHPLNTYVRENAALAEVIEKSRTSRNGGTQGTAVQGSDSQNSDAQTIGNLAGYLREMSQIIVHYDSKGRLLYPVLDANYDITGPSSALWTEDDDIKAEIRKLIKAADGILADENETGTVANGSVAGSATDIADSEDWIERYNAVVSRIEQMISKEENILFPICAVNFTGEEWKKIYIDSLSFAPCFGIERDMWEEAKVERAAGTGVFADMDKMGIRISGTEESEASDSKPCDEYADIEVILPGGHMTLGQLRALLNTIPGEITFIDNQDINRFYNEGPKDFKRPALSLDRTVWTCHSPKVEQMARAIIEDFRAGKRDERKVWLDRPDKSLCIMYLAVRDTNGNYVGTLEFVQDMTFARDHFSGK